MGERVEKIFGSGERVRIMKLFLFNAENVFDMAEVARRAKVTLGLARRELLNLEQAGFLQRKMHVREVMRQKHRKMTLSKKKREGWRLNYKFGKLEPLYNFLSELSVYKHEELIDKISKGVKLELFIISGIFLKEIDSRVDMLIVGDGLKLNVLEETIKNMEAEIGREIRYSIFETSEFKYRLSVFLQGL